MGHPVYTSGFMYTRLKFSMCANSGSWKPALKDKSRLSIYRIDKSRLSISKKDIVTSADVCLSSPAAKSRIEASETKFAWSAQRLSPVSRPATNSGDSRESKSLSNIKESLYKSKERTEE